MSILPQLLINLQKLKMHEQMLYVCVFACMYILQHHHVQCDNHCPNLCLFLCLSYVKGHFDFIINHYHTTPKQHNYFSAICEKDNKICSQKVEKI